ncbi:MAG: hypothetical protein Rubg2KO_08860 [Rubricoccaceae bacterium]
MHRALLLSSLFLIATVASAQTDRARSNLIDGDFGPATMVIEYQDGTDLFRPATLTLAPASDKAKPIPRGAIDQIGILSKGNGWIIIQSFLSSGNSTAVKAEAMLPAPDDISMILIKPQRGPWRGWKVEQGSEGYTEVEWTYFNQRGREVRSAPCAPRACFRDVTDAFNQAESTASSFRVEINGFSFGVERE